MLQILNHLSGPSLDSLQYLCFSCTGKPGTDPSTLYAASPVQSRKGGSPPWNSWQYFSSHSPGCSWPPLLPRCTAGSQSALGSSQNQSQLIVQKFLELNIILMGHLNLCFLHLFFRQTAQMCPKLAIFIEVVVASQGEPAICYRELCGLLVCDLALEHTESCKLDIRKPGS